MKTYALHRLIKVARPLDEAFAFFSAPENLALITPPSYGFKLTASSGPMGLGTILTYRIRVRGFPVTWVSEIAAWEPPRRFVDVQKKGPYRWWEHEHTFVADGGATFVGDNVSYAVPGGDLVQRLLVRPDLEDMFEYRATRLLELLGRP